MSIRVIEHDTGVAPSVHDERFEALIMQTMSVFAPSRNTKPLLCQSASVIEILRSGAGVDFLPRKSDETDTILGSFIEGIACERSGAEVELTQDKKGREGA